MICLEEVGQEVAGIQIRDGHYLEGLLSWVSLTRPDITLRLEKPRAELLVQVGWFRVRCGCTIEMTHWIQLPALYLVSGKYRLNLPSDFSVGRKHGIPLLSRTKFLDT